MTTQSLTLGFPELAYRTSQTGRTCRGAHAINWAVAANDIALAHPAKRGRIEYATPNASNRYRIGYTRNPGAKVVYVAWYYRAGYYTENLAVDLQVTDGTNIVASSNARIPDAFKARSTPLVGGSLGYGGGNFVLGGEGYLDVSSTATVGLGATLTASSDWSFDFLVTRPVGTTAYVDFITLEEVPRGVVDDTETYGVIPGFNPGTHITAGDILTPNPDGLERLFKTVEGGRLTQRAYLSLSFVTDTTAAIPQTTSASYAAMTNLDDGAGAALTWTVRVRNILARSAAGERCRARYLYYVAGGGTADIRLTTGVTTYDTTGLTGASWQWSSWKECYLATNGGDQEDTASVTGRTSAGTLYVAAVQLDEDVA